MSKSILKVSQLHKSYAMGNNSLHVLKGLDIDIKEGEMVSIMGSSGSGKSRITSYNVCYTKLLRELNFKTVDEDYFDEDNTYPQDTINSRLFMLNKDYLTELGDDNPDLFKLVPLKNLMSGTR